MLTANYKCNQCGKVFTMDLDKESDNSCPACGSSDTVAVRYTPSTKAVVK